MPELVWSKHESFSSQWNECWGKVHLITLWSPILWFVWKGEISLQLLHAPWLRHSHWLLIEGPLDGWVTAQNFTKENHHQYHQYKVGQNQSEILSLLKISVKWRGWILLVHIRVFHENMFLMKKNWLNPLCKYLEVGLKESKRIFDFDKGHQKKKTVMKRSGWPIQGGGSPPLPPDRFYLWKV